MSDLPVKGSTVKIGTLKYLQCLSHPEAMLLLYLQLQAYICEECTLRDLTLFVG